MKHTVAIALLSLLAACEHTKGTTNDNKVSGSASGTTDTTKPATGSSTVEKGGAGTPAAIDSDAVKPPTKEDLAGYLAGIPGNGKLMATIETSQGTFHCELFAEQTPMTVANFVGLATGKKAWQNPKTGNTEKSPYFDGLIFHRVIPGFMIQGGDPLGRGMGGPGYNFDDEIVPSLTMKPGTLAMANAGPGTNGSQFFITEGAPDYLNGKHTIFGQCAELDLVTKITGVPRDRGDRPVEPVTITHVTFSRS
jgi:peptidyl-prolyl cis-trans isomerase A (cyclophilin A)